MFKKFLKKISLFTGVFLIMGMVSGYSVSGAAEPDTDPMNFFQAEAEADLLYFDLVNLGALGDNLPLPLQSVAEGTLGVSSADANELNSNARGANLDSVILGAQDLIPLSEASQSAPEDNDAPVTSETIGLDMLNPLLSGGISESSAWARDTQLGSVVCPAEGLSLVSQGITTTTGLGLLDGLISLSSADESIEVASETYVGSEGEVISLARSSTATVNVADELVIDVVDPVLTSTVTGVAGGASTEYSATVRVNGTEIVGVSEQTLSLTALEPLLGPVDDLLDDLIAEAGLDAVLTEVLGPVTDFVPLLGSWDEIDGGLLATILDTADLQLSNLATLLAPTAIIEVGEANVNADADGTFASGNVRVLNLEITLLNTLLDTETSLVQLELMPMSTVAAVNSGGFNCVDTPDVPPVDEPPVDDEPPATDDPTDPNGEPDLPKTGMNDTLLFAAIAAMSIGLVLRSQAKFLGMTS